MTRFAWFAGDIIPDEWAAVGVNKQGRTVVGAGQGTGLTNRTLEGLFGSDTHILTEAEMAGHVHSFGFRNRNATYDANKYEVGTTQYNTESSSVGGNLPHNNIMPSVGLKLIYDSTGGELGVPLGEVMPFTGSTPPVDNFIFADGAAVSRTIYADLFALIGTAFGVGDGSTTFNVPNITNNTPVAVGQGTTTDLGGSGKVWTLGEYYGSDTHQLSINEMPSHHHNHSVVASGSQSGSSPRASIQNYNGTNPISTLSAGSDQAHENRQPFLAINYIIRAL